MTIRAWVWGRNGTVYPTGKSAACAVEHCSTVASKPKGYLAFSGRMRSLALWFLVTFLCCISIACHKESRSEKKSYAEHRDLMMFNYSLLDDVNAWGGRGAAEKLIASTLADFIKNQLPFHTRLIELINEGQTQRVVQALFESQFLDLGTLRHITNIVPEYTVKVKTVLDNYYTPAVVEAGQRIIEKTTLPGLRNNCSLFLDEMRTAGYPKVVTNSPTE